jgi:hypothetical protein
VTDGFEEVENTPKKIRVFTLEHRAEGGRAYKVVTEDGYYFDMREGVLLDTLVHCGCEADGTLGGEFVSARR